MAQLKQAMNLINTGDENSGPTQSMGKASVPAGTSEHFTRAPDKSRMERLKELRRQCLTDLEYEIESSQEHWTEVETEAASDDEELEAANREVFERLMEQWRCPKTGLCFFHDWGENLQVGRKITEGGQAEIFEAEIEGNPGYVVKVFKKEYSLKDLERQWPRGMFQPQRLASSGSSCASSGSSCASSRFVCESSRSSVASWFSSIFLNRKPSILRAMKQSLEAQRSEDKANQDSVSTHFISNQASVSTHFIHDNCCFIHGATLLKNGRFAFVMERYWGDLRRYIDLQLEAGYREPFAETEVRLYIMLEIAKGMLTLHSRGILHRDLKASNVLVRSMNGDLNRFSFSYNGENARDVVDVADFESSSAIVGTGFWRAPEVLSALKDGTWMLDSTPWTEKSDVYAYAMTCYEVLTGRIPFEGVDGVNNDRVINGARPPWFDRLSMLHSDLRALVMKCWHANPSERPNFEEIVSQLGRYRSMYKSEHQCPGAPARSQIQFKPLFRENRRQAWQGDFILRIFAEKQ